jgi:predicted MPP superfamily phosphohydrolase
MTSRSAWQAKRAHMEKSRGRSSTLGPKKWPLLHYVLRFGGNATRMSGLWGAVAANSMKLAVSEVELRCPRLPKALDGFTILHLSDLHFEVLPAFVEIAAAELARHTADIAVITGDFQIDEDRTDPERACGFVRTLMGAINTRHGVYGTLGNHDSWTIVERLEEIGVQMLINEHAAIGEGNHTIRLIGIDDVHAFYTDEAMRTLQDAPDGFRIMLAHTPEVADIASASGYDLYLAGHTHGGQICLPNGRPLLTGLDRNEHLASGAWRIGAMHGYTNRGLGTASMPLRINCPPEIAVLRLRSGVG